MGRYYTGDIEGKFWFGVQNSNDASFFGGTELEPNYINYEFGKDDLPTIKQGVKTCKQHLGKNKAKLDKFFKENNGYNDKMLKDAGFENTAELMEWYARLELGEKILACVKKQGYCSFEAEL